MKSTLRRPLLAFLILLVVWETAVRWFELESWLLPAPSLIATEMVEVLPAFLPHAWATLRLVLIGFSIGTLLGIATGTLLHVSERIRETIYPFLIVTQNIPIIVLAPLLMIWFGLGDAPKLMIIAMTSFFPIAISTLTGLQQTDRDLLHYMKMSGATAQQLFFKLQLPYALPSIFSGIKIAATYSVMTGVVAEWLGAQQGIGVFMTLAASSYRTPRVFVAIVITILLSISFIAFIQWIERRVIHWNRKVD